MDIGRLIEMDHQPLFDIPTEININNIIEIEPEKVATYVSQLIAIKLPASQMGGHFILDPKLNQVLSETTDVMGFLASLLGPLENALLVNSEFQAVGIAEDLQKRDMNRFKFKVKQLERGIKEMRKKWDTASRMITLHQEQKNSMLPTSRKGEGFLPQ
jgi:hypothetical protein